MCDELEKNKMCIGFWGSKKRIKQVGVYLVVKVSCFNSREEQRIGKRRTTCPLRGWPAWVTSTDVRAGQVALACGQAVLLYTKIGLLTHNHKTRTANFQNKLTSMCKQTSQRKIQIRMPMKINRIVLCENVCACVYVCVCVSPMSIRY